MKFIDLLWSPRRRPIADLSTERDNAAALRLLAEAEAVNPRPGSIEWMRYLDDAIDDLEGAAMELAELAPYRERVDEMLAELREEIAALDSRIDLLTNLNEGRAT